MKYYYHLLLILAFISSCAPLAFAAPPVVYKFDPPMVKTGENMGTRTITLPRASSSTSGYLHADDFLIFQSNSLPSQTGQSGKFLTTNGTVPSWSSVASGGVWGSITGTLSNQTDLQSALDAKQDSLSFTAPLVNTTGTVTCTSASGSVKGCLTAADWTTFNGKQDALTIGNLTDVGTDGISVTGGTGSIIGSSVSLSQHVADSTHNGYLSSSDWSTFNGKQSALSLGNLTEATSSVLTITGGTGAIVGSGLTIQVKAGGTSQNGYISSTDWNTFNGKQSALKMAIFADQKTLGTDGGACNGVSANNWLVRTLNTTQVDYNSGITLSSNQLTVPSGTWYIQCKVPQFASGNRSVAEIYDVTNSADKASVGCVGDANSQVSTTGGQMAINCILTLSGTTVLQVQQKFQTAASTTSCLGQADGASGLITGFDHETYTQCILTKLQ